jgi:multidrug efflux pump subunit AcrB
MALDLQALLARVRVETKYSTNKQAINARLAQKDAARIASEQYARSLEKRHSVQNALAAADLDAFRFRWLIEHQRLAGLGESIQDIRNSIDILIKQETIRKLSEMRRKQA